MTSRPSDKYKYASPDRYSLLKNFARENRLHATTAEEIMWEKVRNKKLGYVFRRQHIIYDYIVDFVCIDKMLIIEVDGAYHAEKEQQEEDKVRTSNLKQIGFRIIRFTNEEVIWDTDQVVNRIERELEQE